MHVPIIRGYDQSSHGFTAHVVMMPDVRICVYMSDHADIHTIYNYTTLLCQSNMYEQLSQLARGDVDIQSLETRELTTEQRPPLYETLTLISQSVPASMKRVYSSRKYTIIPSHIQMSRHLI